MAHEIPAEIIAAARACAAKTKIPASVTLAQWALESAWGTHMPAGSDNPFGIKALDGQKADAASTHENVNGHQVTIMARFRQFGSLQRAFDAHAMLLATDPHYAKARAKLPDALAFADALTGVYATDPQYGTKLREIMLGHDLLQYDCDRPAPPAAQR